MPRLETLNHRSGRRNGISFAIEDARKFRNRGQDARDVLQAEEQDVAAIVAVRSKCRGRCRVKSRFGVADDGGVVAETEGDEGPACERDIIFHFLVGVFRVRFIACDEVLSARAIDGAAAIRLGVDGGDVHAVRDATDDARGGFGIHTVCFGWNAAIVAVAIDLVGRFGRVVGWVCVGVMKHEVLEAEAMDEAVDFALIERVVAKDGDEDFGKAFIVLGDCCGGGIGGVSWACVEATRSEVGDDGGAEAIGTAALGARGFGFEECVEAIEAIAFEGEKAFDAAFDGLLIGERDFARGRFFNAAEFVDGQRRDDGDDRDDHQEFDERECFFHVESSFR